MASAGSTAAAAPATTPTGTGSSPTRRVSSSLSASSGGGGGMKPSPSSLSSTSSTSSSSNRHRPEDFLFGRLIGEGSFSSVFLCREVSTGKELAVKVCDKLHILKEKKQEYIHSEKHILMHINANWDEKVPFFVKLYSTFQDSSRLFFTMTYAKHGDLLKFIDEMAERDIDCTQFYAGELLLAVEFLHKHGIVHRDLKPENILLNSRMHILITDFGSGKQLVNSNPGGAAGSADSQSQSSSATPKRKSFVGTAQYVSPEILTSRGSSYASDLWAIGCILYQMCTGLPPFQSQSEYLIFQKIQKLEYSFHEGFDENAQSMVRQLLVIEPTERLGAQDPVRYTSIRAHAFFKGLDFDSLHLAVPPAISALVPTDNTPDPCWERNPNIKPGVERIGRLMMDEAGADDAGADDTLNKAIEGMMAGVAASAASADSSQPTSKKNIVNLSDAERMELLEEQKRNNKYHKFVEGNLIIKQGILDKKKGLWSRRRMFLLTEGPHLYYVDPDNMVLKGEIPWSKTLKPEIKNFKIFFVETPNRVYYLIDPQSRAKDWCHALEEVKLFYYGKPDATDSSEKGDQQRP